jgi:hypothetical protein
VVGLQADRQASFVSAGELSTGSYALVQLVLLSKRTVRRLASRERNGDGDEQRKWMT